MQRVKGIKGAEGQDVQGVQGSQIGNFKFEAYFEVLLPLYMVDSLRTLKVYHYLSLVTTGCR